MSWRIIHLLPAAIICGVSHTSAAEPEDLVKLRESYVSAKAAASDPLKKRYIHSLHNLKLDYTQSGNLDGALAVENELKAMTENPDGMPKADPGKPLPKELAVLQGDYLHSVEAAVFPLAKKYAEALEPMKLKYTQLAKLDAAVAVDNEIKSLPKPAASATSGSPAPIDPAKLTGTRWRLPDVFLPGTSAGDRWVRFKENGVLEAGWSPARFSWKINAAGEVEFAPFKNKGNVIRIAWDNESREGTLIDRTGAKLPVNRVN